MSSPTPTPTSPPAATDTADTADTSTPVPWYGPMSQFWPHLIIWAIVTALFISIKDTFIRLWWFVTEPRKSIRGLWYCVSHPCRTLAGYRDRLLASLRHHGLFFTGTCVLFTFVLLPGAGLFGELAEWAELSEAGSEAQHLFGAKLIENGSGEEQPQGHEPAVAEARI